MAMATRNNTDINNRANESAKKAKQLSPGAQYAITTALPNVANGAFWGFTTMQGVQQHIASIRDSGGNILARKVGNSCLLEVNPAYLLQSVQMIDPNLFDQEMINSINKARAEAHVAFEKFLIARGKEVSKTGRNYAGTIGIYCTNDVTTIAYKGVNYPAFRLASSDVLGYLSKYGYMVAVNGNYCPAQQASQAGQALWDSMRISPTKTGVFLDICSTYNAEQIKVLEQQFKIRTGQVKPK